jgi:hypothetical protein
MKLYNVKGEPITKQKLRELVDECDFNHKEATTDAFPFRIGVNWYWALFMADTLIGFEVYGVNDPELLITLGKQNYFNVILYPLEIKK